MMYRSDKSSKDHVFTKNFRSIVRLFCVHPRPESGPCFSSVPFSSVPFPAAPSFSLNRENSLINDPDIQSHAPEDVRFKSADGVSLYGWYFRARGPERGTILVCHGNVENMSTHVKLDLWLIDAGYNLFIFDYRGYGNSEGEPDVTGINRDAEAALETLLTGCPAQTKTRSSCSGKAWAEQLQCIRLRTRRTKTGSRPSFSTVLFRAIAL